MSATGYTPISLYYSSTTTNVPTNTNLVNGELAINITDGKLFYKDNGGVVQVLATKAGAFGTVTSVAATVPSFLSISGSPITSSGTLAIGLSGTALPTTSGGTGLTSFTANGVVYASSTSALATGSALTFDGTTFKVAKAGGVVGVNNLVYVDVTSSYGGITLNAATGQNNFIELYQGGTTKVGEFGVDAANSLINIGGFGSYNTRFYASGSEQMRLTSTGLGIGTSSPATKLQVSSSGNTEINISGTSGSPALTFLSAAGGSGIVAYNKFLRFGTITGAGLAGFSETMQIDTSGNLGLGVTPSAWRTDFNARALQLNNASFATFNDDSLYVAQNGYLSSTGWKYTSTRAASSYVQNAGSHAWSTAASGTAGNAITFTQAMTLSAAGGLSVGTTADPGAGNLAVGSTTIGGSNLSVYKASGDTRIYVGNSSSTTAQIGCESGGNTVYIGSTTSTPVIFRINDTEKARIDTSGFACINTNAALASAYLNIKYDPASQYGVVIQNTSTTFNGSFIQFRNSVGTGAGQIISNGTATVAYQTSSDYRLKENIAPMTGALAKVTQLKPVTYTWKADGSEGQGFIAHELQEIVPDCVGGKKDAVDEEGKPVYQGIDTSFLVATLTAAIQEQQTLIQSLTDRLNALESK